MTFEVGFHYQWGAVARVWIWTPLNIVTCQHTVIYNSAEPSVSKLTILNDTVNSVMLWYNFSYDPRHSSATDFLLQ